MNGKRLFELYKGMEKIAMTENAIADRYYENVRKMHTPIHLCNGQEAVAVGVCENLKKGDMVFSNHRCHGHYLAKGGDLKRMIAELYSRKTGCCKGKGGSMHLCDVEAGVSLSSGIVAGNVSIATGYALGNQLKGNSNISCVFFGDGASEEGSVYESICFAKIKNIPILYVCENNLYAINTAYELREPKKYITDKFAEILSVKVVDGNDIEAVYDSANDAIDRIRRGQGPVMLEYLTYRTRAHHNIGNGIDGHKRTQEEWDMWNERNPIKLAEKRLVEMDEKYIVCIENYRKEIEKEIEKAFKFAEESSFPDAVELWEDVWG